MAHKQDLAVVKLQAPDGSAQEIGSNELKAVTGVEPEYQSQSPGPLASPVADTKETLGSQIPRRQDPGGLDRVIWVVRLDRRSAVSASKAPEQPGDYKKTS